MERTRIMNDRMKKFYSDVAIQCAKMSRAIRLQVGCVIVKDDNILSFSWNGTPAGWDNNCEDKLVTYDVRETVSEKAAWSYNVDTKQYTRLKTKPEVLHAERNAIDKLAKKGNAGGDGAYLFCTHAPCMECAKSIYGAGIRKLFYLNEYRSTDGIEFLKKCGVDIEKLDT